MRITIPASSPSPPQMKKESPQDVSILFQNACPNYERSSSSKSMTFSGGVQSHENPNKSATAAIATTLNSCRSWTKPLFLTTNVSNGSSFVEGTYCGSCNKYVTIQDYNQRHKYHDHNKAIWTHFAPKSNQFDPFFTLMESRPKKGCKLQDLVAWKEQLDDTYAKVVQEDHNIDP